jgi:hypothetical protein
LTSVGCTRLYPPQVTRTPCLERPRRPASNASLFRDGVKIGEMDGTRFNSIDVPRDDASYRMELHLERGTPFTLSTKMAVASTFRYAHVDGSIPAPLPVLPADR